MQQEGKKGAQQSQKNSWGFLLFQRKDAQNTLSTKERVGMAPHAACGAVLGYTVLGGEDGRTPK